MEIKIVGQEQHNDKPMEPAQDAVLGGVPNEIERNIIKEMFDLEGIEVKKADEKINTLFEYVRKQNKELTPDNIRWTLKELELKLGTPPLSEKRINWLARYAFLMGEKEEIEKEIQKYY